MVACELLLQLIDYIQDGVGAFFKKLNSTQTLNDLVDFDRYLYRHNLPTFEIPFAHIRDIVADVASPLWVVISGGGGGGEYETRALSCASYAWIFQGMRSP